VTFEPRFTRYRYVDSRAFRRGVKKYASLRKQIVAKINRVLDNPYDSELLGKKGVSDLRGKRSVRVTRNIRIVFAVCEECLRRGFKRRGFNDCASCTKEEPDDIVVFLIVAPHETAYGEK
jgi:mRNA-degrading endonuclease RelE of RelBE toxin-antitoxin system